MSNAETIGRVLYTSYIYYFQAAGLVLLVAMIGAIVLTLKHKPGVRRESIADQVAPHPEPRAYERSSPSRAAKGSTP